MPFLRCKSDGCLLLSVSVQPRASRNQLFGLHGDCLKIRLTSPPVDGKANNALIAFLADILDISKSDLRIESGLQSRRKVVRITGCDEEFVRKRLALDT